MRHFLLAIPGLGPRHPMPATVAVALLALRVLAAAPEAVLIALPGTALRLPARLVAAALGAVDVAAVTPGAEDHLPAAAGAVEHAAEALHRGGRREPARPPQNPARCRASGPCRAHGPEGAAPARTRPAPHRSHRPRCSPSAGVGRGPPVRQPETLRAFAAGRRHRGGRLRSDGGDRRCRIIGTRIGVPNSRARNAAGPGGEDPYRGAGTAA